MENLGQIKFKLTFEGKTTSATSDGSLYVLGKGAHLLAKVNQNAAVLYEEASSGANHVSLVSRGAVDSIVDAEGDYFKLSMGSWMQQVLCGYPKRRHRMEKQGFPDLLFNQEVTGNI